MPHLVHSNIPQSPDIGQKSDVGISDFRTFGQPLIKENCHNCRTSDDIGMKHRPVPKPEKTNEKTSKKLTVTSYRQILTSLSVFRLWPIWSDPETGFQMYSQ